MMRCAACRAGRAFPAIRSGRRGLKNFGRGLSSGTRTQEEEALATKLSVLPASLDPLGFKFFEPDVLRARFDDYDTDGSGSINVSEARQLLLDAKFCEDTDENEEALRMEAERVVYSMATDADGDNAGAVSWESFKAAVDRSAEVVDRRVVPISAALLLNYSGQGASAPILPLLGRSLGLSTADVGLVAASSSLARVLSNVPASALADRVGRRPMLIAGPAVGAVAFGLMSAVAETQAQLMCCNALAGVGGALITASAGLYLADISTPRNRARTNAPVMVTALLGFVVGPAVGGVVADYAGLHAPFLVCSAGMALASASAFFLLPETQKDHPPGLGFGLGLGQGGGKKRKRKRVSVADSAMLDSAQRIDADDAEYVPHDRAGPLAPAGEGAQPLAAACGGTTAGAGAGAGARTAVGAVETATAKGAGVATANTAAAAVKISAVHDAEREQGERTGAGTGVGDGAATGTQASSGAGASSGTGAVPGKEEALSPAPVTAQAASESTLYQWRQLLARRQVRGLNAAVFVNGFGQGAFPVTTIIYATEVLSMSASEVGAMFAGGILAMAVATPAATKVSDRVTHRRSIMIPAWGTNAALGFLLPLCQTPLPFVSIFAAQMLVGSCTMPSVTPYILDHAPKHRIAQALAMRNTSQDVGSMFGASTMGFTSLYFGVPFAMYTVAALQLASTCFFAWESRPEDKDERTPGAGAGAGGDEAKKAI